MEFPAVYSQSATFYMISAHFTTYLYFWGADPDTMHRLSQYEIKLHSKYIKNNYSLYSCVHWYI